MLSSFNRALPLKELEREKLRSECCRLKEGSVFRINSFLRYWFSSILTKHMADVEDPILDEVTSLTIRVIQVQMWKRTISSSVR